MIQRMHEFFKTVIVTYFRLQEENKMPYVTLNQQPMFRQITLDDILDGKYADKDVKSFQITCNYTNTRTVFIKNLKRSFLNKFSIDSMLYSIMNFTHKYEDLIMTEDKSSLYKKFYIPKKSGGLREINAPQDNLMLALRELKQILEEVCGASYHTSAFAYVKGRNTVDAIKRHQRNESKWFLKLDFHDFFGSTTQEFVMERMKTIFPFSEIVKRPDGEIALEKAISLCFLNGGLPQGTPISPTLTNLMMIPIDLVLCNTLRKQKNAFIYTRYADDMLISSKYDFDYKEVEKFIVDTLESFNAPFQLNVKKTRYASSSGSNWNLGVMLNKDNDITIGYKKKYIFKAMCNNYLKDKTEGRNWEYHDVQVFSGLISYYKMIEKEYIEHIIEKYSSKYNLNLMECIREDLK